MRVLLLNSLYLRRFASGAARSTQAIAEGLVALGHDAIVCARDAAPGLRRTTHNDVRAYYIGRDRGPLDVIRHLLDVVDRERSEVIHSNSLPGFPAALLAEAAEEVGVPWIHTLREYHLLCRNGMIDGGTNCASQCEDCLEQSRGQQRFANRAVDAVVGVSRFTLQRHLDAGYFARTPIRRVIHNAYSRTDEPAAAPHPTSADGPLRLGFLGRLVEQKGILLLIDSLQRGLPSDRWELWIGGDGPDAAAVRERAAAANNLHPLGRVEPAEFFSRIDTLVVPSLWHEPLARVTLEALTHGVAVIGSNRGGIAELIDEGRTGFVFDPAEPQTLVDAVRRLDDDRSLLAELRRNAAGEGWRFTPQQIAREYVDVYRAATGAAGAAAR